MMASKTKMMTQQLVDLDQPAGKIAKTAKIDSTATMGFAAKLWLAADKLRQNPYAGWYPKNAAPLR